MRSLLYGLLLASGVVAAQDVYKCVDDQGRTTYTQAPPTIVRSHHPLQSLPDSERLHAAAQARRASAGQCAARGHRGTRPASSRQRPVDDVTVVGGSSSSSSSRQETEVRGSGIIYQPVPVYIDRRPRNETWHMVPHPQAQQPQPPAPPPPPNRGIPIDR